MFKSIAIVSAFVLSFGLVSAPTAVEAGWNKSKSKHYSKHRKSYRKGVRRRSVRSSNRYRRTRARRAQVRGFWMRGGYSYRANDVANTYGNSRTRYGSVNSYRDPFSDRQTSAGPFDHGFFFDSAVAPRGGDSPYMQ